MDTRREAQLGACHNSWHSTMKRQHLRNTLRDGTQYNQLKWNSLSCHSCCLHFSNSNLYFIVCCVLNSIGSPFKPVTSESLVGCYIVRRGSKNRKKGKIAKWNLHIKCKHLNSKCMSTLRSNWNAHINLAQRHFACLIECMWPTVRRPPKMSLHIWDDMCRGIRLNWTGISSRPYERNTVRYPKHVIL